MRDMASGIVSGLLQLGSVACFSSLQLEDSPGISVMRWNERVQSVSIPHAQTPSSSRLQLPLKLLPKPQTTQMHPHPLNPPLPKTVLHLSIHFRHSFLPFQPTKSTSVRCANTTFTLLKCFDRNGAFGYLRHRTAASASRERQKQRRRHCVICLLELSTGEEYRRLRDLPSQSRICRRQRASSRLCRPRRRDRCSCSATSAGRASIAIYDRR